LRLASISRRGLSPDDRWRSKFGIIGRGKATNVGHRLNRLALVMTGRCMSSQFTAVVQVARTHEPRQRLIAGYFAAYAWRSSYPSRVYRLLPSIRIHSGAYIDNKCAFPRFEHVSRLLLDRCCIYV